MPSPILFFIFMIVIDLILKSSKDKKKIEQERQKKVKELEKQPSIFRPMEDLKRILEEEIQKDKQREALKKQPKENRSKVSKPVVKETKERTIEKYPREDVNLEIKTSKDTYEVEEEHDIKRDLLMGIVFSEILSEPKSIQNQRRSL